MQTWEQINGGTNVLLANNIYNEVGQLWQKNLHSTNSGSSYLQTATYTYNERGWSLGSSAPLFEESLQYNTGTSKQYNGNIAYANWGTSTSPDSKTYAYSYDKLNRLLSGTSTATNNNESGIAYDLEGNLTALTRTGYKVDNLAYSYTDVNSNNTNQLQSVTDGAGSTGLVTGTTKYVYDLNGNIASQANTTATTQNKSYSYNILNLPQVVNLPTGTVTYYYDADGNKLRKVSVISGTTTTEDYISGIQHKTDGTIDFIQTEEGRALNSANTYHYEYSLTDHLGNERLTFDTYSGTASTVQTDDYYPFGLEISTGTVTSPKNEYLYNKKELQEELGQYDYGARFYDPVIARWMAVDPMAELGRRETPYGYAFDDPMRFTDPDGMWPDWGDVVSTVHDVAVGAVNATFQDATGKDAPSSHSSSTAYNAGRIIGHLAAIVGGTSEGISGGEATVGGVVGAPETGGISLVLSAGGVAMVAHASFTIKNAIVNLATGNGNDKSHGNKLDDKPAERYTLRDRKTGEVVKHGETTRGEDANGAGNQKRYSKNQLKDMDADYQKENSGSKKDMHQEQHQEILNHKANNNGKRPKYNKNDY